MNRLVSRRLNMAVRVRDFCDTNPSADPSFTSVLRRLKEAITRMVALGSQQVSGILSRHASSVNRQQIRRRLRNDLLRHLVTIAQDASTEKPGLGDVDTLLDDLAATVTEFEGSITATNTSREGHIAARAELERVGEEVVLLVGMMDGINRYRFRNDPHLLVAWEAAKHVVSGPQPKSESTQPTGPSQPGGPAGEVKPAA